MKIAILAGEKSGDNYGALLAESIKKILPGAFIFGTGGEKMNARMDLSIEGLPFGKMGFSGVLANIRLFYRSFKKIKKAVEEREPSLIIFIDNPGFNLKMAEALGEKFPCFYYVPPKIWAHNYGRIKTIKKYIKGVVAVFPFEEEIYLREGILCGWFGHPAADLMKYELHNTGDSAPADKKLRTIGLLPGSRQEEVNYLLPVFIRIVEGIAGETAVEILLSASDGSIRKTEETILKKHGVQFKISEGAPHSVIKQSDILLAASGTINMEAALMEKPMLVFYKTSVLNYLLARIMVKLRFVSPVNLLAGEKAVPEYIQRFPCGRIIMDCMEILHKGALYRKETECFRIIKKAMGSGSVSAKTAEFILRESGLLKINPSC
ncbi:MAG: lipid-A-disaccharide synthase [Candidatus Omnitrophica bacterium]|nr:lipid-A-disaccharide synthase [Candidatus Omnitrophota bacterium]